MLVIHVTGHGSQAGDGLLQWATEVGIPGSLTGAIGSEIVLVVIEQEILDVDIVRRDIFVRSAVFELVKVVERRYLE